MQILLFVVVHLEIPSQSINIGHEIIPAVAAGGDPLRSGRAKVALLVEEAVHVQEVARVGVVGGVLTVQVLAAVLLAGGRAGDRGQEVLGKALAHTRVSTL